MDQRKLNWKELMERFDREAQEDEPKLSPADKVELFQAVWSQSHREPLWRRVWENGFAFIRRPAFHFALGAFFGVFLTVAFMNGHLDVVQEAAAEPNLKYEQYGSTVTVRGKTVSEFYSMIENPVIVIEKVDGNESKRVVYGTMANDSVDVVLNF